MRFDQNILGRQAFAEVAMSSEGCGLICGPDVGHDEGFHGIYQL